MTIEEFEKLTDQEKRIELFEAQKIAERKDGFLKYELFKIDDFFVEIKTSNFQLFKRIIRCYNLPSLPQVYGDSLKFLWS